MLLLFCGHVLIIAQIFMDPPDLRILLMGIEFDLDIIFQWIGLRENLQETMVFTIKYRVFL